MPAVSIIGTVKRVVDAPGLAIDELAGNVATKDSRISIAKVTATKGTSEPFLTMHYDEWICVLKGKILFESSTDNANVTATAGDTVSIKSGTRVRPSFIEDCEYVPVCLPAFSPDLCIREDGDNLPAFSPHLCIREDGDNLPAFSPHLCIREDGDNLGGHKIAEQLNDLQNGDNGAGSCTVEDEKPEILYHMTTKAEWENAKSKSHAYYPKTFEVDGDYTHATGVPSRLIETANHFYQDVEGDWICLQFRRSVLRRRFGIVVRDEKAMPVGEKQVSEDWSGGQRNWICPHVYGGLPLVCVEKEYKMVRDGVTFVAIEGLVKNCIPS